MSKRFSYRRGKALVCDFSLIFTPEGDVRITRGLPAMARDEREMRMTIELPLSIFERPQLSAKVTIADTPVPPPAIDIDAAREALRDAIGADVAIHIVQPERAQ